MVEATVDEKKLEKKWLGRRQTAKYLGIGATTLDRWRKDYPDFPKPVRVTERKIFFNVEELDAWMEKRRANGRKI